MKYSLVVPVAPNRGAEIIESIKELDYPKSEYHVVVVKGLNPSENRNKGYRHSKGEIIVFLDDDAHIEKDYLRQIDRFFDSYPQIDIVGGPQLTPLSDKGFARYSGMTLSSLFGAWKIANRYSEKKVNLNVDETALTSANMIVRKHVMTKVLFDPKLFPGEDPKFIYDAKVNGFKVAYSPDIKIYHMRRHDIKSFSKQIYNYGVTRPKKESIIQTLKMPFFLIPSLFLIYLVILLLTFIINPQLTGQVINIDGINIIKLNPIGVIFTIPLALYIVLAIIFGLYDSVKHKEYKAIFVLPFIYPIIHLSYGWGFIRGYLNKIFR